MNADSDRIASPPANRAAGDERAELREARQHLNHMIRACRQTITYLQGKSCLDQRRLGRILEESVRSAEKYLER